MDNIAPCRICFTYNKKMHSVTNVPLLDLYEKLTSVKLSDFSNICRNNLCSMCYAQLRRCHSFQQAAIKAAHFLEQLYLDRIQLTTEVISMFNQTPVHNYTVTPVDTVNIEAEVEERNIKQEIDRDDDSQEALEITSQNTEVKVEFESRGSSGSDTTLSAASDSEEDMPLHKLKNVKGKRKENMKEDATTDYNDAKLGFQEVILTEQQQKEAMAARALSDNYLHAPHRCTMCCRGFNNLETFKNHLEKHVESSGPNICKLCSIRYKSERLLKAHTHAAHARQYICNQCNVVCSTRHQASDHARIHSGDFYECKLCGKRFHARTSYLTHMRATHAAAARHVCVACGENFISNHGLRMHQARAHARAKNVEEKSTRPEDRRCVPCNVQFLCRRAWLIHTLTTPSHKQLALDTKECPICKKVIPDPMSDHLTQHEAELKRARDKPPAAPPGVKVDCGQKKMKTLMQESSSRPSDYIELEVSSDNESTISHKSSVVLDPLIEENKKSFDELEPNEKEIAINIYKHVFESISNLSKGEKSTVGLVFKTTAEIMGISETTVQSIVDGYINKTTEKAYLPERLEESIETTGPSHSKKQKKNTESDALDSHGNKNKKYGMTPLNEHVLKSISNLSKGETSPVGVVFKTPDEITGISEITVQGIIDCYINKTTEKNYLTKSTEETIETPDPSHSKDHKNNTELDPVESQSNKNKSFRMIPLNERRIMIRLHDHIRKSLCGYPYKGVVVKKTADIMGISKVTVARVLKEYKTTGQVSSPKRTRNKPDCMDKLNEFTLLEIKKTVQQFYDRNEPLTVRKIAKVLHDDKSLPTFCYMRMYRILKRLGVKLSR